MVHSNSNCLTGVNKFLKRNPCQGCFTDTSAYQCPCFMVLPQETVKIHCRCFGLLVPAVVLPGLTFAAVVRLGSS